LETASRPKWRRSWLAGACSCSPRRPPRACPPRLQPYAAQHRADHASNASPMPGCSRRAGRGCTTARWSMSAARRRAAMRSCARCSAGRRNPRGGCRSSRAAAHREATAKRRSTTRTSTPAQPFRSLAQLQRQQKKEWRRAQGRVNSTPSSPLRLQRHPPEPQLRHLALALQERAVFLERALDDWHQLGQPRVQPRVAVRVHLDEQAPQVARDERLHDRPQPVGRHVAQRVPRVAPRGLLLDGELSNATSDGAWPVMSASSVVWMRGAMCRTHRSLAAANRSTSPPGPRTNAHLRSSNQKPRVSSPVGARSRPRLLIWYVSAHGTQPHRHFSGLKVSPRRTGRSRTATSAA